MQKRDRRRPSGDAERPGRPQATRRIVVLVVPPIEELDLVGPVQVFSTANRLHKSDAPPYEIAVVTLAAQASEMQPIQELQVWIADHLRHDLSTPLLAERVSMSVRNFVRVFAADVGTTP